MNTVLLVAPAESPRTPFARSPSFGDRNRPLRRHLPGRRVALGQRAGPTGSGPHDHAAPRLPVVRALRGRLAAMVLRPRVPPLLGRHFRTGAVAYRQR